MAATNSGGILRDRTAKPTPDDNLYVRFWVAAEVSLHPAHDADVCDRIRNTRATFTTLGYFLPGDVAKLLIGFK